MNRYRDAERGQAIVIAVFVIVGLLAVTGLAIDGGSAMLERRRMQNAADAAALAATRILAIEMCSTNDVETADGLIRDEMLLQAGNNGVENLAAVQGQYVRYTTDGIAPYDPPVLVGAGVIPHGAVGVRVTTAISRATHFLGLVGQQTAGAGANATAITGPPLQGSGIRPFGLPYEAVANADPGDCFTVVFKNCTADDETSCPIEDESGNVVGHHRNWLNLGWVWNAHEAGAGWPRCVDSSGDAAILKELMRNGWQGTIIPDCYGWDSGCRIGDFAHAKPGTTSSPIGEAPEDEIIYLPVFDKTPSYPPIPAPKPVDATQGGGYYYHIVDLVPVEVVDQRRGQGEIDVCLLDSDIIIPNGQANPAAGGYGSTRQCALRPRAIAVTLWR